LALSSSASKSIDRHRAKALKKRLKEKHKAKLKSSSGFKAYASSGSSARTRVAKAGSATLIGRRKSKKPGFFARRSDFFRIWGIRAGWAFCAVLLLQLVFSKGGVIDYYSKENLLAVKFSELEQARLANQKLAQEIDKIRRDEAYQKQLARDNLGVIGQSEYLILFATK